MSQLSMFYEVESVRVEWKADRESALARLSRFLPGAGANYAQSRNTDFGPERRDNISCLSPWIRHRVIPEQEVITQTLARFSPSNAEKFIQEVFWRGYFKGWLEQHPSVWTHFCSELEHFSDALKHDPALYRSYQAAINAETGIDCFDGWVRELAETNYLHNHARMWFASIWIFTLKLPWQLGASLFLQHLLDGDPASNTLSWRWVGGLHTKGKTYCARADNIHRFTAGRYNPHGQLAAFAPPLDEDIDHPRLSPPASTPWQDWGRYGLLLTEEDGNSESLDLPHPPAALATLPPAATCGPVPLSDKVLAFRDALQGDAALRAAAHFGIKVDPVSKRDPQGVLDWARREKLETIVVSHPPVGPTRDWISAVETRLSGTGISCHTQLRPYDRHLWPHANAGFFKVKKKIPRILQSMNMQL